MPFCTCLKRERKLRYTAFDHQTKQGWLLNGAHRGGGSERAENTTGAFLHALENKMNLLELDVHLTKDGQVVVSHDEFLDRMCGPEFARKKTSDYNFAELPKFARQIQ
jgi:glycerophosphoryl diester phosphodiesterase